MNPVTKGIVATTLAASALASIAPVQARDYYRHHGDNTAAVGIGAGVIGLALGAIVASSGNTGQGDHRYDATINRDDRDYDRSAYDERRRYDNYDWQRRGPNYDSSYYGRRGY